MSFQDKKSKDSLVEFKEYEKSSHSFMNNNHDESNWLISYADMMTLLCGFFIMLYSMSKLDVQKYDKFKEEIAKQFGGDYQSQSEDLKKFATEIIQEMDLKSSATVKRDSLGGVSIVFESTIFFDTLSANVSFEGEKMLLNVIDKIKKRQEKVNKEYRIIVEGHTDGRPIVGGNYPSNWELSGARASRVVRMFLERGFTPHMLAAIGYADTLPQIEARLVNGKFDVLALSKNRRVVIRILNSNVDSIPLGDSSQQAKSAH